MNVELRRPYRCDPLPPIRDVEGLVVLGGAVGPYDDARHPWLVDLKRLLTRAVAHEVPVLGIAAGGHVLATALGGTVTLPAAAVHTGLVSLCPTPEAPPDPLLQALEEDTAWVSWSPLLPTELPAGAVVLAEDCPGFPQVVRYGPRAWGFQGHPEVDPDIVGRWVSRGGPPPGSYLVGDPLAELRRREDVLNAWEPVFEAFFSLQARAA